MKSILCYGDSNTWGYMPGKEKPPIKASNRYPREVRWTGLLQKRLGDDYLVIEEGLNGRTTMFDSPTEEHRNGLKEIDVSLLTHLPIDLVILLLGINDTKQTFQNSPEDISQGVQQLIRKIKGGSCGYGPEGKDPEILIVSPVRIHEGVLNGWLSEEFTGESIALDLALPEYYRRVAQINGVHFLDACAQITADPADGIHMNADGHRKMATLLETRIRQILS